jgi:excisionase family DNA binding protein
VDSGDLDAIDVSVRRGKKRRLRIPEDALRKFLERRRVYVEPPRSRVRQHKPRQVIDYFGPLEPEENGRRRLKVSEVAEYLGVKEDYVRALIAYGHLAAMNIGGPGRKNRYRICEKELYAFVERSRNKPRPRQEPIRAFLDKLDKQQTGIPKIGAAKEKPA